MRYADLFQKCPRCGAPVTVKDEQLVTCSTGDFTFFINPAPCNAVIIENENHEILLVKRKFDPQKDFWDLPGGFVDPDESAENSVRREIREELQCEVVDIKYITSYPDTYLYRGTMYHTVGLIFSGKLKGVIRPTDDITEHSYFSLHNLPTNKLAFPSTEKALHDYKTKLAPTE